jgi:hypothetical protein
VREVFAVRLTDFNAFTHRERKEILKEHNGIFVCVLVPNKEVDLWDASERKGTLAFRLSHHGENQVEGLEQHGLSAARLPNDGHVDAAACA